MIKDIYDWIRARILAFLSGGAFVELANALGMTPIEFAQKIVGYLF